MKSILNKLWIYFKPFTNWKFLISFGLAWFITNGWAWLGLIIGNIFHLDVMVGICGSYMAFLWLPFTPEKIITIPLAIWFQTLFFKRDKKLRLQLEDMKKEAVKDFRLLKYKAWCYLHQHRLREYQYNQIGFNKRWLYESYRNKR